MRLIAMTRATRQRRCRGRQLNARLRADEQDERRQGIDAAVSATNGKGRREEEPGGAGDRDQIRLSCAHVTADVATGRQVTASRRSRRTANPVVR